jgi:hypothetical protein
LAPSIVPASILTVVRAAAINIGNFDALSQAHHQSTIAFSLSVVPSFSTSFLACPPFCAFSKLAVFLAAFLRSFLAAFLVTRFGVAVFRGCVILGFGAGLRDSLKAASWDFILNANGWLSENEKETVPI